MRSRVIVEAAKEVRKRPIQKAQADSVSSEADHDSRLVA
jgi:hypothetical protein